MKICPGDLLGVGQGFRDKSPVQSTSKGLQRVRDERRKRVLDWYGNVQEYRGDLV